MSRSLLFAAALFLATPASAHIKLTEPPEWIVTNAYGDPQKDGPCGSTTGTPSGVVTTVTAGSKLTVKWTETILHKGHFRIAISADRTKFITPDAGLTSGGSCDTAPIDDPPVPPVLLDGLFVHSTAAPNNQYQQEITVPDIACDNCTLQLIQFMSEHAPSCWYFHCAALRIVKPTDGGLWADGGMQPPGTAEGCGCASGPGGLAAFALLGLAAWIAARRRAAR